MTETHPLDSVRSEVGQLARGRRRLRCAQVFGRTIFWGLVVVALAAFWLGWQWTLVGAGAAALVAAAAALIAQAMVPVDLVAVAKRYDDKVGTVDLLSSALELEGGAFATVVREEAQRATGKAGADELYPAQMPREVRWLPAPIAVAALTLLLPILLAPKPAGPSAEELAARALAAEQIQKLLSAREKDPLSKADQHQLEGLKNLAERLKQEDASKKQALAELAKLQSQLDKERQELESKKLEIEKNSAKLSAGEDAKDAKRDMDAGRYREAANKVKKKIEELQKKLEEEAKKKEPNKASIEGLKNRVQKLKELLADLEMLDALGKDLGFLVEVMETLERIEGELGKLKDWDGDTWDEAEMGRPGAPREGEPQKGDKLLVFPSNESGEGHVEKFKTEKGARSLTERDEKEAKLREGKGKSRFGQVKTANDGSKSKTEFADTALAGKRAAEDTIHRQNIPAGYRTYIRRYFELMQPDDRPADK